MNYYDTEGAANIDAIAAREGVRLGAAAPDASWLSGIPTGLGLGAARLTMKGASLVYDFGNEVIRPFNRAADRAFGTKLEGWFDEGQLNNYKLVSDLKPDPATTGVVGQVMHGLIDLGGSALIAGPGGAGVLEGMAQRGEMITKGVDKTTANLVGTTTAITTAVAVGAPMSVGARSGIDLGRNAVFGAGVNMATGMAQRGATHNILKSAGYQTMAEQYEPLERDALIADGLLGAFFGTGTAAIELRASGRARAAADAALTSQQVKHAALDTAPGVPTDPAAASAHAKALDGSLEALLRDKPVEVPPEMVGPAFATKDNAARVAALDTARAELTREVAVERPPTIGDALQLRVDTDFDVLRREYEAMPETKGGRVHNTDLARELSPEYRADRGRAAEVYSAAGNFIKKYYAARIAELPPGQVLEFTAGGAGAGKSTALGGLESGTPIMSDGVLGKFDVARAKIDAALDAGHKVIVHYVYRDPIEAWKNGVLTRARDEGRPVKVDAHAAGHKGSFETVRSLIEQYAGDERVSFRLFDNSGEQPRAVSSMEKLPQGAYNGIEGKLNDILDETHAAGAISDALYERSGGSRRPLGGADAASAAQRETPRAPDSGQAGAVAPEVQAARAAADSNPDLLVPTGMVGEDGKPQTLTAREIADSVAAQFDRAEQDAKAYEAAIICMLGNGS